MRKILLRCRFRGNNPGAGRRAGSSQGASRFLFSAFVIKPKALAERSDANGREVQVLKRGRRRAPSAANRRKARRRFSAGRAPGKGSLREKNRNFPRRCAGSRRKRRSLLWKSHRQRSRSRRKSCPGGAGRKLPLPCAGCFCWPGRRGSGGQNPPTCPKPRYFSPGRGR